MLPAEKPKCRLSGEDGNVFNVIGKVGKALRRAGYYEYAREFTQKAVLCKTYNEVLSMCHDYVEVE